MGSRNNNAIKNGVISAVFDEIINYSIKWLDYIIRRWDVRFKNYDLSMYGITFKIHRHNIG